jgi:hypothetical protein
LAETFHTKLLITSSKKKKAKSPQKNYSGGGKLDKNGAAKVSKKRRPDTELRKKVSSFKKQKKDIRKIEIQSDISDEDEDEDDEFDEEKDLGSETEFVLEKREEEENDLALLPKLQERLLLGYQKQQNVSPTKLIQSFLFAAVKLYGRDRILLYHLGKP